MNIPEKSAAWAEKYKSLAKEERYDYFLETLSENLSDEILEKVDLVDYLLNLFSFLDRQKEHDKILNLIDKIYQQQGHILKKGDYQYLDQYLLDIKLYQDEIEFSDYQRFIEASVESIDKLIPYLKKTIYYGYQELACNLAEKVFKDVEGSPELMSSAGQPFAEAVYFYKLQTHYEKIKAGQTPDKDEFLDFMLNYNYKLNDYYKRIINYLTAAELTSRTLEQEFLQDRYEFIGKIYWSFLKQMAENKGANFQIAENIWREFRYLQLSDQKLEEAAEIEPMFILDRAELRSHLQGMTSFLSDNNQQQYISLWGLVYVYDFLYEKEIISERIYKSALKIINWVKPEVLSAHSSDLWKYSFIHSLAKPESIEPDIFEAEKKLFRKTYNQQLEQQEIDNLYPTPTDQDNIESIDIGRNDPCPCGSGRKHKKCCLRKMEKQERRWKQNNERERNLIWTQSEIAEMSTEEIINKLFYFGVYFNQEVFKSKLREGSTIEVIMDKWLKKFEIRAKYFDRDFLVLAAEELKNRLDD